MSDLISREAAIEAMYGAHICGIIVEGKFHAIDLFAAEAALRDLPAQGQPAAPRPPIQAEGYDIDVMVANLKAHPEWPAMNSAGDVKLYFMNEADAWTVRFAASLERVE